MADFKKKKVKKKHGSAKNLIDNNIRFEYTHKKRESNPATKHNVKPERNQSELKVIAGNKLKKIRIRYTIVSVILAIVVIIAGVSFISPTGIFELTENLVAKTGFGKEDNLNLSDGHIKNVVSTNNNYIVLTESAVTGFNKHDKKMFYFSHGMENPIIKRSSARFIVFDQGKTQFYIHNLNRRVYSGNAENNILSANIARNGTYAVATTSSGYTSEVKVYDKNGDNIYSWYCSDYYINDVVLSPNGKILAVSAVSATNGVLNSRIYILKFDSATPVLTLTYDGEYIISLKNNTSKDFYALFDNKAVFVDWKTLASTVKEFELNISNTYEYGGRTFFALNRITDKSDNTVVILDKKLVQQATFNFTGNIVDFRVSGSRIYILSDKNIYCYDFNGQKIAEGNCSFGVSFITPLSDKTVAEVDDRKINKITLNDIGGE